MNKIYTGIGSRETPPEVCDLMSRFAYAMAAAGWHLRSGGADGADLAFERGCLRWLFGTDENGMANYRKGILLPDGGYQNPLTTYLPTKNFNSKNRNQLVSDIYTQGHLAVQSVDQYHPCPRALNAYARKLMARNYQQVMGHSDLPSVEDATQFIVCWTLGDELKVGGTSQALRIANDRKIPWLNLAHLSMPMMEAFLQGAWNTHVCGRNTNHPLFRFAQSCF